MTRIRGCCTRLRRKRYEIPKVAHKVTNILLFGGQILLFVIRERELVHEICRKRYEIPQVTLRVEDGLYFIHAGRISIFMESMQQFGRGALLHYSIFLLWIILFDF